MGQQVRRATIRFHGDSCGHQYRDEQELKLVCLHETGHALGIYRHLKDTNAIMNAFAKENDVSPYLTEKDKETICSLYQNHPVNQSAVMKFIGQLAVSQKLDESLGPIAEDVQRSSLLPVSISDAHFGKR